MCHTRILFFERYVPYVYFIVRVSFSHEVTAVVHFGPYAVSLGGVIAKHDFRSFASVTLTF